MSNSATQTVADEMDRLERFIGEYGELLCFLLCLALAPVLLIHACVPEAEPAPAVPRGRAI